MDKHYKREDASNEEVIFHITIPGDAFEKSYEQLLKERSESLDIKGFRKGNVPSDLIEPQLETLLLAETFERIAPYYVNAAIIKENVQPAAPPEYKDLEEMKKGQDVAFNVSVTVIPEFTLADISKLKIEKEETKVTNDEIQQSLETMYNNNVDGMDKDKEMKLTDDWAVNIAKSYGIEGVKTLDDLRSALREMMTERKANLVEQEYSSKVMREIVNASKITIPESAIKYEAEQREEAFKEDLERANMKIEDFLKQRNVTMEQLKEMWMKDSQEALENDTVLKLYAESRDIELSDKELAEEVENIKKSARAQYEMEHAGHDHESHFDETVYDDPQWQSQIRSYLVKQKAFRTLQDEVAGKKPKSEPKGKGKRSESKKPSDMKNKKADPGNKKKSTKNKGKKRTTKK